MKTLSTTATVINAQGFVEASGITVLQIDETADQCEKIVIGATTHRADELQITKDRIISPFGWEVVL